MAEQWRCFFGNSGAEAIEAAMKLARYTTGRYQFIAFQNSFHGRTMGALSLTSSKPVQRKGFGPLVPGVTHIPYPNPYRCPLDATPDTVGDAVLQYLEDVVFKTTVSPGRSCGNRRRSRFRAKADTSFLRRISCPAWNVLRSKHGILIDRRRSAERNGPHRKDVCDSSTSDFHPDIIALAKGIASGMPLGVMMARSELMTWEPGAHASTFGGNPVCLAAALETVRLLEEKYVANSAKVGAFHEAASSAIA